MKKTKCIVIVSILMILVLSAILEAGVISSPSSVNIARDSQSTVVITYRISNDKKQDKHTTARSEHGLFKYGAKTLVQVNEEISGNLKNDGTGLFSGVIKETLTIPQKIFRKAKNFKANQLKYIRVFKLSGGGVAAYDIISKVPINITTAGRADLQIKRIQLYFDNKRATISVKKRQPSLKAFADIKFNGSGLLQCYWQVDGRILSHINRHIVHGKKLTLETPGIPALPTFSEGPHIVTLIITKPEHHIVQPKAIYFVHPGVFRKKGKINLVEPIDHSGIDSKTAHFKWYSKEKMAIYLIEFIDDQADQPVFSAITKKQDYRLPIPILKYYFTDQKTYFWRVKGFNHKNKIVGESPIREFKLD